MNAKRAPFLKAVRYCCYLAFPAILVYLAGNLLGFDPEQRAANNTSPIKSDKPLIQKKQPVKPTPESYKEISDSNRSSVTQDRERAEDPKDLPQRIENRPSNFSKFLLVGIINSDGGRSQVIIEDRETKTQRIYTEGSEIGGAKVVRISSAGVVLSVNGNTQVLDMTAQQNEPLQEEEALPPDESNWWKDRSYLGYAEVILKARLKPFLKSGNQEGFEVKSILGDSPLRGIGLEEGDIIRAINDKSIDSDLEIALIDDAITNGDSYTLSVVRNGKRISLPEQVK